MESVSPLPKCLHIKACPRIIWPHRNIHPHPVSDVGPVPPVMHTTTGIIPNINKELHLLTWSLTNWGKAFSVGEPQTRSNI